MSAGTAKGVGHEGSPGRLRCFWPFWGPAAAWLGVAALPDGYDTHVAPGTAALSGGRLKRITIARAMLRAAPVLILDEPTAGLDSVAARQVVQPLRRLMSGAVSAEETLVLRL